MQNMRIDSDTREICIPKRQNGLDEDKYENKP